MPLIQVTLIAGRSVEMKETLIRTLTDGAVEATGAPRESIRVILQEVPAAHWGVGGMSKARLSKEAENGQ